MKNILFLIFLLFLPLSLISQNWNEIQKVVASDRNIGDEYGFSVSIFGSYAIVGSGAIDSTAGAAYILKKDISGNWVQLQKLISSDRQVGDFFGRSVAINQNYAVIGAYNKAVTIGGTTYPNGGAAYIFKKNSVGNWIETDRIIESDIDLFDHFGWDVALDGNTAVVSNYSSSNNEAAYVFTINSNGIGNEIQKLSNQVIGNERFGYSIAISGNYIAIGAPEDGYDASGNNFMLVAGSVSIYKRNNGVWSLDQKIVPTNRAPFDRFGLSVALTPQNYFNEPDEDPIKLVVGTPLKDFSPINGAGAVYIFKINSNLVWNQLQMLRPSISIAQDNFGLSVACDIFYEGGFVKTNVLIGSRNEQDALGNNNLDYAGAAYLFKETSPGFFVEDQKIVPSDRMTDDLFSMTNDGVAIDNNLLIIGAIGKDTDSNGANPLDGAGAVYIFKKQ